MLSVDDTNEPRFQINAGQNTQQIFGIDVDGMRPEQEAIVDGTTLGFPRPNLNDIPPGQYWVKALLHRCETFHRADSHTVKLPMDRGEGQHRNRAPGNLYSTPQRITLDPKKDEIIHIRLDRGIPTITPPKDIEYIKHVSIQSELLTEFRGRPMRIGACVLLPHGFDDHPEARYPLIVNHGHFPRIFGGCRETSPDGADLTSWRY